MSTLVRAGVRSPRPHFWRLLLLPALALLLAPCSGSSVPSTGTPAGGTATASATSSRVASTSPGSRSPLVVPQRRLTLADAWGNVAIHRLPTAIDSQHVFVFENAATPDGAWLLGAVEPRNFIDNTTERSVVALYNVATRQLVRIHPLLSPQSQIISASVDDSWVVWSEADDQPNFFDWTMFAYNRRTGAVRQLAQAVTDGGNPVPGPAPMPTVDQGRVVWGQAIGTVSQATIDNAVVRMEDLTTGQVTTLATAAGSPAYQWPWVIWGQVTGGSGGFENLKNVQTGQETRLHVQAASLALSGKSLAYNDSGSLSGYLIDDFTSDPTQTKLLLAFRADSGRHVEFLTMSDRLVAWREDGGVEVWDRTQQAFVQLPISNGASDSWVQGHLLVWFDPEPADQQQQEMRNNLLPTPTLDIINTSTLPTAPVGG